MITTGVLLAAVAAIAFGAVTPAIAWAGAGLGPLTIAALLYAGAAGAALLMQLVRRDRGGALRRSDLPRIAGVAIAGAAIAPVCLAWGLSRTGATVGSLVLNLEAVLTVILAWAVYREPIGRRVGVAVGLMALGGAVLVLDASAHAVGGVLGAIAVGLATLAWATDNTLSRGLAERDPLQVIVAKGALGALITGAIAVARGEPMPPAWAAGVLLACGATGYGVSLRLYLLAQRRIGAARTGSVFAIAPFVGAAIGFALGDRSAGSWTLAAAGCFALGVYLHVTEHHHHAHVHESVEHDHAHRHDDGHHDHAHASPIVGEHSHAHHHDRLAHDHDHAPDLHHDHAH